MKRGVCIDAGPIVALADRRDKHHAWARSQVRNMATPLWTCEAVLCEAMHLLKRAGMASSLWVMLESGFLEVSFSLQEHLPSVLDLMRRYANVPMSLADACLVRMCELEDADVFTTDSDFYIYRRHGRQALSLIISPHG